MSTRPALLIWAVFAHSTIDLTDNLQLLLGGRYNIENQEGGVDVQYWYDSAIVRAVLESLGVPDDGTPRNGLDLIGTLYSPSFSRDTEDKEFTGTIGSDTPRRTRGELFA